jgi:hypothetical protein
VAVDADLRRVEAPGGARREISFGVERWLGARRVAIRAGGRAQTIGQARPAASGGVSVAVRPGAYLEAFVTGGADRAARGWGVAARLTY